MRFRALRNLALALAFVGAPSACSESTANSALSLALTGSLNDHDVTAFVDWAVNGSTLQPETAQFSLSGGMLYVALNSQELVGDRWVFQGLTFNVPARLGTYALATGSGVSGEGTPTYLCFSNGAVFCDNGRGTITVSRAVVQSGGGDGIFDVAVSFNVTTDGGRQVRGTINSCVDRHSSVSCTGGDGGSGGGGGGTGGGGNETCSNSFELQNVTSYYASLNILGTRSVSATGLRVNQSSTPFAGTSPSMQALVLNSTEQVGSPAAPRYQLQIYFPGAMRTVSQLPFLDNNNVPGLENGAAGWLSLRGNGVFDGLRSNRDYSRTITMGNLTITSISPKIRGTISSLRVIGDGYPSLSDSEGFVRNVVFCIDP